MRARLVPLLGAAASGTLVVAFLTFPPAQARPAEGPISASAGKIVLIGKGNGHGRGMSQYGARGAAIAGLKVAEILEFYYPTAKLSTDTRRVKVLITQDNDRNVIVLPEKGLKVIDLATGKGHPLPANGQKLWRLRTLEGKTRVAYTKGKGWKLYKVAGKTSLAGAGEFRTATGAITLRTPAGDRRYRGGMRLVSGNSVNILGLDSYVRGVVPREMPTLWQAAAVQAQAVAARTYAARAITDNPNRSYHLCDTSLCQVYGGVADEEPGGDAAVKATSTKILTYRGKPAFTQFSASNGGHTLGGTVPYLPSKADPYDATPSNPYKTWRKTLKAATIQTAYPAIGTLQAVQVLERDSAGKRVSLIKLIGSKTSTTLDGGRFRSVFGLRSTYFNVASS